MGESIQCQQVGNYKICGSEERSRKCSRATLKRSALEQGLPQRVAAASGTFPALAIRARQRANDRGTPCFTTMIVGQCF